MKRAQNSDSKTHVKKQNPTSRTEISRQSLKYLFLETPCSSCHFSEGHFQIWQIHHGTMGQNSRYINAPCPNARKSWDDKKLCNPSLPLYLLPPWEFNPPHFPPSNIVQICCFCFLYFHKTDIGHSILYLLSSPMLNQFCWKCRKSAVCFLKVWCLSQTPPTLHSATWYHPPPPLSCVPSFLATLIQPGSTLTWSKTLYEF